MSTSGKSDLARFPAKRQRKLAPIKIDPGEFPVLQCQNQHEVFLCFAQSFQSGARYREAQALSRKVIEEKLLIALKMIVFE